MKHTVVITRRPVRTGVGPAPDGAVCGNGDLAAVLGESGTGVRIHLGKSDLWCASPEAGKSGIRPLGCVDIDIPGALYETYCAEQRMDTAQTVCIFRNGFSFIEAEITVPATRNAVVLRLSWSSNFECPAVRLTAARAEGGTVEPFCAGEIEGARVSFDAQEYLFPSRALIAMRKIFSDTLSAEYLIEAASENDGPDAFSASLEFLKHADEAVAARLLAENKESWENFWAASGVSMSDKALENDWYASQYLLAVTRGTASFPAGLSGNIGAGAKVPYGGAYALGGRYEAPYFAAVSSNHAELTDNYLDPLLDAMDAGRAFAKEHLDCGGIFYPGVIGPKGLMPKTGTLDETHMFFGQKIYASYAAAVPVMRLNKTMDAEYARKLYPYLSELAQFWTEYMTQKKGKYGVEHDSPRRIPYDDPKFKVKKHIDARKSRNSVVALGAARMVFGAMIVLASLLPEVPIDAAQYEAAYAAISPYPRKGGKFAPAKKGLRKAKKTAVAMQHIFPLEQVVFDKKNAKRSRKTVDKSKAWFAQEGAAVTYVSAVRSGVKTKEILSNYKKYKERCALPNGLYDLADGGQQNIGLAAAMLNEMMLRTDRGVITVFPNWPEEIDCSFTSLRADGAFLVDGEMKHGTIRSVRVTSEKGVSLSIRNPFEGKNYGGCVAVIGGRQEPCSGSILNFDLAAGESVSLSPAAAATPKAEKKALAEEQKAGVRAQAGEKKALKDAAFFTKLEDKAAKKQGKKARKRDKKENKKFRKFDKKTAKQKAKRAKKEE